MSIHVLKLTHALENFQKMTAFPPQTRFWRYNISAHYHIKQLVLFFCVILSLRHKRASIVIFLTMLFNMTIEAMKYQNCNYRQK